MSSAADAGIHACAVLLGETGVLVRGAARSGKSALVFASLRRFEAMRRPAALVSDDRVLLHAENGRVFAQAPAALRGLIEVSGVGILAERWTARAALHLVVDLAESAAFERLPERDTECLAGVRLRRIVLPARQASFGADVLQRLALDETVAAASLTKS